MEKDNVFDGLGAIGATLGKGLIAGLIGTAAITVSQMIEMKITKRKASDGPANAVENTLDIHPAPGTKKRFGQEVHWTYGTLWGVVHGVLAAAGVKKWAATTTHFAAIFGTALAMAPLEDEPPVTEWEPKQILIGALHHAVYAVAVGLVFDAITGEE